MDLDLGPEIARFRAELRDWIAAEAPDGLAELADWNMAVTAGGNRRQQLAAAAAHPAYADWERKLAAAGNRRQANKVIDAVIEYVRRLMADGPWKPPAAGRAVRGPGD